MAIFDKAKEKFQGFMQGGEQANRNRRSNGGTSGYRPVRNLPNMVFNASTCGDNCARWLLKIAKEQDVLVTLYHIMKFPWKRFEIRINNDGRIVRNMQEFVGATNDFLDVDE